MWAAISTIGGLVLAILNAYFTSKAAAAAANQQFVLDQDTLRAIVKAALDKQLASMASTSQGASNAWDAADGSKPSNSNGDTKK